MCDLQLDVASAPPSRGLMVAYGFACGLPLPLSGFTLGQWLAESGVALTAIGFSTMIGLSYTLKFLWAPLLDRRPFWAGRRGRRRAWLLVIQPALALAGVLLALSDPAVAPARTVAAAALLAFCSASQDIVVDAWRIETWPEREQGRALAAYVWGYRGALLVANPVMLRLATAIGWHGAFLVVTALGLVGIVTTLLAPEPAVRGRPAGGVVGAVVAPLREFTGRPQAAAILAFVALFNLGEAVAGVMLPPYYRALGYLRDDVALANLPSLAAALIGVAGGGWLVAQLGAKRALVLTGFAQMLAILIYALLQRADGAVAALIGTVSIEAFIGGFASAAFLAYLSTLCAGPYTATQYALLSSLAALPLRTLAGFSGLLAGWLGWHDFFLAATVTGLPAMLIMLYLLARERAVPPPCAS